VTAAYAGTDQLPAAVEAAVRAQQNNATSVSLALAAARILEKVCCTLQLVMLESLAVSYIV
jgi:hypothetical protein